jgi:hypothetical protein
MSHLPTGLRLLLTTALIAMMTPACAPAQDGETRPDAPATEGVTDAERVLTREMSRIEARTDSIDRIFQPLPLLRPAEEAVFTRFGNQQQLQRARALGIQPGPTADQLTTLQQEGRLVRLDESTGYWVIRELDYSVPLVVPSVQSLLVEIGERFHARLNDLDLPAFRYEITSVLRSADDQQALRRVNPNAAAGTSTHQFGTTIDIAYSAFAAPAEPVVSIESGESAWLRPHLESVAAAMTETVAARRSRELQAILGRVLIEMQQEGKVMVTMERLQPVYHMTVARRLP